MKCGPKTLEPAASVASIDCSRTLLVFKQTIKADNARASVEMSGNRLRSASTEYQKSSQHLCTATITTTGFSKNILVHSPCCDDDSCESVESVPTRANWTTYKNYFQVSRCGNSGKFSPILLPLTISLFPSTSLNNFSASFHSLLHSFPLATFAPKYFPRPWDIANFYSHKQLNEFLRQLFSSWVSNHEDLQNSLKLSRNIFRRQQPSSLPRSTVHRLSGGA